MGLGSFVKGLYQPALNTIKGWGDESQSSIDKRNNLNETASAANSFADQGQNNYGAMTAEAQGAREALRGLANGQNSLAAEQLRQGLQQNMNAQRSMAASASSSNSPMAALHAAQNMGRMGAGMSGEAAMAGIAERQAAQKALADMIMAQRQQDANVALGSRQNAIGGFVGTTPDKSTLEKWAGPIAGGLGAGAKLA